MTPTPTSGAADLRTAAQAVVDRWDTPLWKDVPATAEYIGRLRAALAAGQATAAQQEAAYAALPEYGINTASHAHFRVLGFTADQMRAFADATHALRASHGQAPASVLHLVHSAFAEIAMAFPKAFALHKVGIADTAVRKALAAYTPQAADSVPAVEREQERIAFKAAHRHLELYEVPDAWGRPMFKHSHVEASWLGWIARASRGQAPAETGNSVSAQADSVLYDPKAVLDVFNSARAGSDKSSGYLRGILAVIAHWESRPEPHRWMVPVQAQAADSVQEDAARSERERICAAIKVEDDYCVEQGDYMLDSDDCIKIARGDWVRPDFSVDAARKQGENHD